MAYCGCLMAIESLRRMDNLDISRESSLRENVLSFPNLKQANGTSIGALFACAVAFGISGERLFNLLDTEAILDAIVPAVDINSLNSNYGLDMGGRLKECLVRVIEIGLLQWNLDPRDACNITMLQLFQLTGIDLGICATLIGSHGDNPPADPIPVIFNHINHPHMLVIDALIMSMTVPMLYVPVLYKDFLYVDGGLLNNVPVTEDMKPEDTLIFRLSNRGFHSKEGLRSYMSAVLYSPMKWLEEDKLKGYNNIINVTSGSVTTFAFNATRHEVLLAVVHGMLGVFSKIIRN